MSIIQLVILSVVLVVSAYFVNRTISSQQTERYLEAIKSQRSTFVELAAKKTPRELDHIFLKLSPAPIFLMPRAKKLIKDHLWLYVTESLNHQLISEWSKNHQKISDGFFAVHSYANVDGLIDSMGKSYYLLPRESQKRLNALNSRSHLTENLTDFFSSFFLDRKAIKIEKKGFVDKPVPADIYGPITTLLPEKEPCKKEYRFDKGNDSLVVSFKNYVAWFEKTVSKGVQYLNPGLSENKVSALFDSLNVQHLDEFFALYKLNNGQSRSSTVWFFPNNEWLPAEELINVYKELKADMGSEWHDQWIPILSDGGASYSFIDEKGRLMNFYFEEELIEEIAPSLNAWLNQLNQQAESGLIKFDEVNGVLFVDE